MLKSKRVIHLHTVQRLRRLLIDFSLAKRLAAALQQSDLTIDEVDAIFATLESAHRRAWQSEVKFTSEVVKYHFRAQTKLTRSILHHM